MNRVLDAKSREWYQSSRDLEGKLKQRHEELKVMKKELKIKQKTLSTYEYLLRLPPEQEQNVTKCRHCPKFFLSRDYLKKHYQRHHPAEDFLKDHPLEGADNAAALLQQ